MNDVAHNYADLGDVMIHYVKAGSGPPVVLLHGWPETWYEWRHVIPALAPHYTVIAPDLRGLGDTSRPATGYDKRTVANDIWRLVHDVLGHESFLLVGHDWGGPTAFALASAHPDAVEKLAILDVVIPGDGGDFSQGGRRWHHAFHMTLDLPDALTHGREDIYLGWFYRNFSWRPDAFDQDAIDEYLRTYTQPRRDARRFRLLPRLAAGRCGEPGAADRVSAADAGAGDGRREKGSAWPRRRTGTVDAPRRRKRDRTDRAGQRSFHSRGATGLCRLQATRIFQERDRLLV